MQKLYIIIVLRTISWKTFACNISEFLAVKLPRTKLSSKKKKYNNDIKKLLIKLAICTYTNEDNL